MPPKNTPEIFWSRVSIPENPDLCWLWQGLLNDDGYGKIGWDGKLVSVHRLSFYLTYGAIPEDKEVLHKCDVRNCCNPRHLFIGTQADNVRDMINKGRLVPLKGAKNGQARLTIEEVSAMRDLYAVGDMSQIEISEKFGVSRAQTSKILTNKSW